MIRSCISVLLLVVVTGCHAQSTSDKLVGLWGTEAEDGPRVRGELTLDGRQEPWRARIAGYDVPVTRSQDAVSFTLPGNAGSFRAQLSPGTPTEVGQWTQPLAKVLFSPYATPVVLRAVAPNVWQGDVRPNPGGVSFYISISKARDGSLFAIIRNPEFGWFQRGAFRVETSGSKVALISTRNPNNRIDGTYDPNADQLQLSIVNNAPPLLFTRRNQDTAVGFYPRTPPENRFVYRTPVDTGDGWTTANLSEVGLDERPIAAFVERILTADPTSNAFDIQSLLIARHGKLVLEEYFYGFTADRPHDTRSAGKTFAPMLLGLARFHGASRIGPGTAVYSLFPELRPFTHWDARKDQMKVADLMSMTAGYDCDEDHSDTAPLNEDNMQSQTEQSNWYKFALDAPMAEDPGSSHAHYCSAELNLVGGIAAKDAGMPLTELFYKDYAQPLQFGTYYLNLQPTGEAYMGGGAYLRPRDQLKLGQLYLNGGTWNGRRILDSDWIKQSLTVHASFDNRFGVDHQYGWGWHIQHVRVGDRTYTEYSSGGNGGQIVLILPDLDIVVGFTGGAYGDMNSWGRWPVELVPQYIIPAAH